MAYPPGYPIHNSGGEIEPTRVFKPAANTGQEVVTSTSDKTYDLKVTPAGSGNPYSGGTSAPPFQQGNPGGFFSRLPGGPTPRERIPGIPHFLASRTLTFFAWGVTMAYIAWDEWHNNQILPRPKRLWWTSATFLILAAVSSADIIAPLCNVLAIGFMISVMMQYYNGQGQFAHSKGSSNG